MATNSDFGCQLSVTSVQKCLKDQDGYFVIPSYQRPYRWGYEESCRLLSDISSYYVDDVRSGTANGSSKNAKFLGTIIVVTEEQKKGQSAQCQSVIDGQQRLITFTLLFECLHHRLKFYKNKVEELKIEKEDNQFNAVITDIVNKQREVAGCLWRDRMDFEPKVGREGQDDWYQHQYSSPTAIMARLLFEGKASTSINQEYIDIPKSAKAPQNLYQVVESIELFIDLLVKGMDSEKISNREAYRKTYLDLPAPDEFPSYSEIEKYSDDRGCLTFQRNTNKLAANNLVVEEVSRLISIIGFICDNVYIAKVICQPDNYLDIFESLNTAGRPLSPIETFTPEVYRFFSEQLANTEFDIGTPLIKGGSDENPFGGVDFAEKGEVSVKEILDGIASLLQVNKVSESDVGAIIISFALLYSGRKCGGRATDQRAELKKSFVEEACVDCVKALKSAPPKDALQPVLNYLRVLYQTVRWWSVLTKGDKEEIKNLCCYDDLEIDKTLLNEAMLALHVCREAKLTLAQTIACRFYIQFALIDEDDVQNRKKAYREFLRVLRALLGFSTLWLGAVESTSGIEGCFREVLAGSSNKKIKNDPACDYLKQSIALNRSAEALIGADLVCDRLKYFLRERFSGTNGFGKDVWCNLVASTQSKRDAISRFMLLAYWQYTEKDEQRPGYRIRRREMGGRRDNFTVESWSRYGSSNFDLEHIIPQTLNEDWAQAIANVDNPDRIICQLGNYTLLPKGVNRYIGNKPWEIKRAAYRVLANVDKELSDSFFTEFTASQTRSLKKILRKPGEDTVSELVDESIVWNPDFVEQRSKHMASIIWDNLFVKSSERSPFIDLGHLCNGKDAALQENNAVTSSVDDSPNIDVSTNTQEKKPDTVAFDMTSLYEVVCARIKAITLSAPKKEGDTATWTTVDGKGYIKVIRSADGVNVIVSRHPDIRARGLRKYRGTKSENTFSYTKITKFDEDSEILMGYIKRRYQIK